MRVLLSDGSGLTARQCAGLLSRAGHRVDVLASGDLPLAAFTRYVHRVHRLPAYGPDPLTWWDAAVAVLDKTGPDVLLPTQEQVGVISLRLRELRGLGVGTAVPAFSALTRVQDKLAADRTLREAGLRRPHSWVATDRDQLLEGVTGPAFLKLPIGTAGTGVVRVGDRREVPGAADRFERSGAFAGDGVLVEEPVAGPLVMVQAVFDAGRLVVLHANDRTREGAGGGASSKTSRRTDDLIDDVVRLGAHLNWQGALSLDAIATADGPVWIDVNPRVVEPGTAATASTCSGRCSHWPRAHRYRPCQFRPSPLRPGPFRASAPTNCSSPCSVLPSRAGDGSGSPRSCSWPPRAVDLTRTAPKS